MITIDEALAACPLVAILRGVTPDEVVAIGQEMYDSGIRCIEVPLNSPDPFASIAALTKALPDNCITGAGTVLSSAEVNQVQRVGGRIIVSPNFRSDVVRATIKQDMIALPGIGTPTEAFAAVECGASWLKVFPALSYGASHIKALKSVLPKQVRLVATGGVGLDNMRDWHDAGAAGFGIGSELYKAGDSPKIAREKATAFCEAAAQLTEPA